MSSNQKQIIEQTEFTYSPLEKAFEKQTETIEDQRTKQADALKDLILKDQTKSTEGIFQKIMKVMKSKILVTVFITEKLKYMKLI